ncbi:hypothetical protein KFL_003030120 [Klebsormidium nitens]|uniref:SHSP domain-containing protein n=1 Tax=Klebsormidium nitens TaxID=105231 RepID=A0A1Y1IB72_KLENI|nr:hypothetical protein KFL_003030120 [Klebsormidium nitens]|eukprot:GAQ86669.1 hypothetical protein KFL_003030120 [Klebsormidium nitens]
MASSQLSSFLRRTAPLARAVCSTSSTHLPGASTTQVALGRPVISETATRVARCFGTAINDATKGPGDVGQRSGVGGSEGHSDVAVKGDRDSDAQRRDQDRGQGYGIGRGRLSPFSFDMGPLFSARGDRDLLNMMDNFFLTPSRFFDQAMRDILPSLPVEPPQLDINESDKQYTIKLQLPGLKKDEVQITVEDTDEPMLRITAHHEAQEGDDQRFWQDVDTRLRLPDETNADDVQAEFKDGVLSIRVPKKEAPKKPEPKKIPIQG